MKRLMGTREASRALGIGAETLRHMCKDGTLRNSGRFGREWIIDAVCEWPQLFEEGASEPMVIMDLTDASNLLDMSRSALYQACERGEVEHAAKIGTMWRINAELEWPQLFGEDDVRRIAGEVER